MSQNDFTTMAGPLNAPVLVGHVRAINSSLLYRIADADVSCRFTHKDGDEALMRLYPRQGDFELGIAMASEHATSGPFVWIVSSSVGASFSSVHRVGERSFVFCEPAPRALAEERECGDESIPADIVDQGNAWIARTPTPKARHLGDVEVPSGRLAVTYAFARGDAVATAAARLDGAALGACAVVDDLEEGDGVVLTVTPGHHSIFLEDLPINGMPPDERFCIVSIRPANEAPNAPA